MSISSTSNTLSSPSSGSSANSTPQPCSLRATPSISSSSSAASPILDCDQLLGGEGDDDDNIFKTKKTKPIVVIKREKQEQPQQVNNARITTGNEIFDKKSDKPEAAGARETATTTASTATSLVTDLCHTEKITTTTTTTTTTASFTSSHGASPVPVIAPSKRPSTGLENVTSATPTILKKVAPIQAPKSKNILVSGSTKPPQVSGGISHQQQTANRWKLGTKLEATCNILSKSSNTTNKSSVSSVSSRPDLVVANSCSPPSASSLSTHSASQVINFKTLPLLMQHNHQFQTSTSLAPGSGSVNHFKSNSSSSSGGGGIISNGKAVSTVGAQTATARPLISALTPQIILSQIITANPTSQRPTSHSATATSTNLEGIQFCLANATATPVSHANTNILQVQSLTSAAPAISSTKSNSTTSGPQPQASDNSNKQARDRPNTKHNVKLDSQNGGAQSSSTNNIKKADSSGAPLSDGNAGNNIAAARLLDLGKKLLEAAREGKLDQVRHLVEDSGAPFTSDWLGTTALHLAAQGGHLDIAEVLVRAGVNRDARTKLERTALHLAAQSGSLEIVDLLLTHGSDVNARDMLKMTPLHWAVERGHVYVAERLLISGADAELSNKFLLTPFDIARELGSYEMIELFKNWTGDSKDDQNLEAYGNDPSAALNESQDFLDIDYHLALVDSAAHSRGTPTSELNKNSADGGIGGGVAESCIDLVEFEWNKFDFDPDLFLPDESSSHPLNEEEEEEEDDDDDDEDDEEEEEEEDEEEQEEQDQKVGFLMKVVEDLKKENQLLRQKVEQLSTVDE